MSLRKASEPAHAAAPAIALAGNPNTGKTSLFNRLTGGNARVGNYPGVTVDREVGRWRLGDRVVEVTDVPGAYSLAARSREEQIAVRALFGADGIRPALAVVVVDATQLVRNLYFVLQLLEAGLPVVVALNLIDAARSAGVEPDAAIVQAALGVPVVAVSARTGEGITALGEAVERCLADPELGRARPKIDYPPALLSEVKRLIELSPDAPPAEAQALALWAMLSVEQGDELAGVPAPLRAEVLKIRGEATAAGRDLDTEIIGSRYAFLDAQDLRLPPARAGKSTTDRVDAILLHPLLGSLLFVGAMAGIFQALFSWSDPAISAIEALFSLLAEGSRSLLPGGVLADFVADGLIGGVGSVLVFLPQIVLLFLFITVLEDSGYLSRVAFLVDRSMRAVGLHGRAFVPMLSGFACAVPAVMATRTLERRRDRLLTMLVIPLMTCSARLPVYTLVIAAVIPASATYFGVLPAQGATMVFMYLFSTAAAIFAAAVLGRTVLPGKSEPLLLELPPYRLPRPAVVLRQLYRRASTFVIEAGRVILACSVVLWALLYFPREVPLTRDYAELRAAASPEEAAELESAEAGERLRGSYGGQLGRAIEPVVAPLGFDWKIGIGLVGAFAAREVFVSTMGVVFGVGADQDEVSEPLRDRIRAERGPDGAVRYTPLVGLSLLVFFALSAQCMSTLAAVRRESGSWRWAAFLFAYMTGLAWVASFAVFQGGKLLGLG